jgi:Ca2+-transporting ATPase
VPNRWLGLSVVASLAVLAAIVYVPALHAPFGTVSLQSHELALVLALAVVPALVAELAKAVARGRSSRATVRLAV